MGNGELTQYLLDLQTELTPTLKKQVKYNIFQNPLSNY